LGALGAGVERAEIADEPLNFVFGGDGDFRAQIYDFEPSDGRARHERVARIVQQEGFVDFGFPAPQPAWVAGTIPKLVGSYNAHRHSPAPRSAAHGSGQGRYETVRWGLKPYKLPN